MITLKIIIAYEKLGKNPKLFYCKKSSSDTEKTRNFQICDKLV